MKEQITTFNTLSIDEDIVQAMHDLGYQKPTPIQSLSIPKLMQGHDLIGLSQTGTGKTVAFAIPLIELIDPDDRRLQAVVLCPTRELCLQVAEEIRKLLKYKPGIRTLAIYGGQPINQQINAMKRGLQIVVATPGRFLDHLRRHTLRLDQVQMAVLDEADEMLDMGFREDMELILSQMPTPRQTVLFSATMSEDIKQLIAQYMEDPKEINTIPEEHRTVDEIEQIYFELKEKMKPEALRRILDLEAKSRVLVFCNTKKQVADLTEELLKAGYPAGGLHGDLKQVQRDLVMRRFRGGELSILVATDVAARGIDIRDIHIVINYDLASDPETYLHRIGRTARAGRSGKAYSFVVGKELKHLKEIMAFTKSEISPRRLPTIQEVEEIKRDQLVEQVTQVIDSGQTIKYSGLVKHLIQRGYDAEKLAAALFSVLLYLPGRSQAEHENELTKMPTKILPDEIQNAPRIKLHLNLGRQHRIRVKDIVGAIAGECGIPSALLGHIDILDTFSYIEVPAPLAQDILQIMNHREIKGKSVKIEMAQS